MRRGYALGFCAVLAAGCTAPPTESSPPYLTGTITSREPWQIGVRDSGGVRIVSIPAMLVEENPEGRLRDPYGDWCLRAAWFTLGTETRILHRNGARADTTALTLGRKVSVWAEGVVLESCPPVTHAAKVVLED